ncbi:MAG: hypothetical protein IIA82_05560 [Thaumarchaeota archaeon]|nr:hypothetical protein [Nitrososphaerota archaeon]
MSYPEKARSNKWFLVPIFFGVIGGFIAFFILRHDDPEKAKNCIYLSLVLLIRDIITIIIIGSPVPEIDSGFNVNT